MKKRLKCKLYKLLFRVLPFSACQVFLMEKHLSICSLCREEVAADDRVKELLVSPEKAKTLEGIWPYVHTHMVDRDDSSTREQAPKQKWGPSILTGWQWKAAVVGLLLFLVIIFSPIFFEKKQSTMEVRQTDIEVEKVVVKSVKIGSKAARFYFFESKDPDKVIVWTERK